MTARLDALIGDVDSGEAKAKRRRLIVATATRLFVDSGYRKTSVEQVATEAGIAKGTLYLYYPNKAELMLACIALEKRGQMSRLAFLFDDAIAARVRLISFVEMSLKMALDMPLTMRLIRGDAEMAAVLADAPPALVAESMSDRYQWIGSLIADAIGPMHLSPSELRQRVDLLAGIPYFASHLEYPHVRGELGHEQYASLFAQTFVAGLVDTSANASLAEADPPPQEKTA